MRINTIQVDLLKTRAAWPPGKVFQPAYVRKFKHAEPTNWAVLDAPWAAGAAPTWAYSYHDQYLRVPLFSYTLHRQTDLALAFLLQVGVACASQLPEPPQELLVVTGVPAKLLFHSNGAYAGLNFWFGFGVRCDCHRR